jgi:hypothetical protein
VQIVMYIPRYILVIGIHRVRVIIIFQQVSGICLFCVFVCLPMYGAGQPDISQAFHTYRLLWDNSNTNRVFRFYFDGREITTTCQQWRPGTGMVYPAPFTLPVLLVT